MQTKTVLTLFIPQNINGKEIVYIPEHKERLNENALF